MTTSTPDAMTAQRRPFAGYRATHFRYECSADGKVGDGDARPARRRRIR